MPVRWAQASAWKRVQVFSRLFQATTADSTILPEPVTGFSPLKEETFPRKQPSETRRDYQDSPGSKRSEE
jgi:hypothetical protein